MTRSAFGERLAAAVELRFDFSAPTARDYRRSLCIMVGPLT